MGVDGVRGLGSIDPRRAYQIQEEQAPARASFARTLENALSEVGRLQERRDGMVEDMVAGAPTEVHDVMVAAEEAQLAFELMLEIRNKLLEAYQEIMRMQQ
jgi:flagellar hook-basal body complex protein FliE